MIHQTKFWYPFDITILLTVYLKNVVFQLIQWRGNKQKVENPPCLTHNSLHRCTEPFGGLHLSQLGPLHHDHQEPEHHKITRMQIQSRITTRRCTIETCICGVRQPEMHNDIFISITCQKLLDINMWVIYNRFYIFHYLRRAKKQCPCTDGKNYKLK